MFKYISEILSKLSVGQRLVARRRCGSDEVLPKRRGDAAQAQRQDQSEADALAGDDLPDEEAAVEIADELYELLRPYI